MSSPTLGYQPPWSNRNGSCIHGRERKWFLCPDEPLAIGTIEEIKKVNMSIQNCCLCGVAATQWILEGNKYYHPKCYSLMKTLSEEKITEAKHLQVLWNQQDSLVRQIIHAERKFSDEELDVLMNMEDL